MSRSTIKDSSAKPLRDGSVQEKGKRLLAGLAVATVWLLVWQLIHYRVGRDVYVPSPLSVLTRLWELLWMPDFWTSVFASIRRVAEGLLLSVIVGVAAAVAAHMSRPLDAFIRPLMTAVKSTPVMSFILLALVWFPSSAVPVFICFLMCVPVIWGNVLTGIRQTDGKLLEMAASFGVKTRTVVRHIYLPSVLPYFAAATTTCLGLGWKVAVAAEVLSQPRHAIGKHLFEAKAYLDSSGLFAWTLVVILLSLVFERLLGAILRRMANHGGTEKSFGSDPGEGRGLEGDGG